MTEREQRGSERVNGADGAPVGGTPGRRTLTQSLPAGRGQAAPLVGAAPFGPVDPPGDAARPGDPSADPFGLHLLGSSQGPSPGAAAAATRAGLGDVSHVRLHDDARAHAVADAHDARALTIGADVYFGAGEYAPGTPDGDRLLGHELAHTAQQHGADALAPAAKLRASSAGDASEAEADRAGDTFAAASAGHAVTPIAITATPAALAFDRKRGRSAPAPGINAAIKVTAYTEAGDAIEWTSRARWAGALPVLYRGTRTGKAWTWDNSGAASVKVNTNESGAGGERVEPWATGHGAVRVTINVVSLDDVTSLDALDLLDYQDPKKRGALAKHRSDALGHALPEEHAGDGSIDKVTPESKSPTARLRDPGDGKAGRESSTVRSPDATSSPDGPHAEPGAETGHGSGEKHRDGTESDDATNLDAEIADEDAEADADDAALDAATDQFLDAMGLSDEDGEDGEGGNGDHAGGSPDGRTGDDTAADGTGKGGDRAKRGGGVHRSKYARDLDGVDAEHDDALGGAKDHGAEDGRVGGEEGGRKGGVRGGGGFEIFGFSISVPAALSGAVEVALIIDEGNILSFGPRMVTRAASEATEKLVKTGGTAALRRSLKRAAAEEAARSMRAIRKEIQAARKLPEKQLSKRQRQLLKEWGSLTAAEAKRAMRVTAWELQRRYFQSALKSAKSEARALRKAIKRTKDLKRRSALTHRLERMDRLTEAAQVQPIAGRLPIGHRFAGRDFPAKRLPKRYRSKGLHIDADGFPEFEPYAKTLPNGKKSVRIEYTGGREADFAAANAAAKLDETPAGYVWHHHQRMGEMILIPRDLHDAVKHTGGVATYKHMHGVEDYGN